MSSPPASSAPDHLIERVEFDLAFLTLHLQGGRQLVLPLSWLPPLAEVEPLERRSYEVVAGGWQVRWPELGLELSARDVLEMEDPRELVGASGSTPVGVSG